MVLTKFDYRWLVSNLFWPGAKFLTQFDLNQLTADSCWTASNRPWLIIFTEHHGPRLSLALSKVQCAFPYIYLFKCCLLFFSQQRSIQAPRPSLSIWTLSTSGRRRCCACWIVFMSTTVLGRRPPGTMIPFPTSFHNHPVTAPNPLLPWDGSLSPRAGGHPTIDFIAFFKQGGWAMWAQLPPCLPFHLIISSLSERLPQEQMQLIGVLLTWFTLWPSILFKCSLKMAQSWSQIFWWMHQQSWMKTQSLQIHLVTLLGSYGHLLIRCGVISCEHEW